MTPAMITAIAYLIAELVSQGVSISKVLAEVKATGRVQPERWDAMLAELDSEIDKFRAKRG